MKNKKVVFGFVFTLIIILGAVFSYYNYIYVPHKEAISNFEVAKKSVSSKNKELKEAIHMANDEILKREEPLNKETLSDLEQVISEAKTQLVKIPKMKEKTSDIIEQTKMLSKPIDYSPIKQELQQKLAAYQTSITQLKQITNPPQAFVEERLKEIESITATQPVTEENDPNGQLNKQGGYTATVFFNDSQTGQSVSGNDLIELGTEAGGSIEVYSSKIDAEKRNIYLSAFDGQGFLNPGSHYVYGTIVIRTSQHLTATQQTALTEAIYHKFIEIK